MLLKRIQRSIFNGSCSSYLLSRTHHPQASFSAGPIKPPHDNSQSHPNADLAQPKQAYAHKAATDETVADASIADEIADETTADETGAVTSFNTANALASDVTGRRKCRASSATTPAPVSCTDSLPPSPTRPHKPMIFPCRPPVAAPPAAPRRSQHPSRPAALPAAYCVAPTPTTSASSPPTLSVPWIRGTLFYSMKTPHPCNTSRPRGEWRPTPPHGQVQGRHVARKGSTSQYSSLGPDLHRRIPDPYTYKSRAPKKARRVPWEDPSSPPSKVQALARSRDEDPGMSRGPVLTRVQALPCAPCCCRVACGS
jgi:hypothetical protein